VEKIMDMDILEQLTKTLPDLSVFARGEALGCMEYEVEGGTSFGWNLLNIGEVAVQRNFMSKGTTFPGHTHPSNEWVVVSKGKLQFTIDHEQQDVVYIGQCQFLPANCFHSAYALEDTSIIGITVPAAEGYPDDSGD